MLPSVSWYKDVDLFGGLGIKLYANGFKSENAAKLAGEKALRELLDGLAREQSKSA